MCMCTKPKPKTPKLQRERRKKNNNTDNNQNSGYIKTNSGEKETKTHKKSTQNTSEKFIRGHFCYFWFFTFCNSKSTICVEQRRRAWKLLLPSRSLRSYFLSLLCLPRLLSVVNVSVTPKWEQTKNEIVLFRLSIKCLMTIKKATKLTTTTTEQKLSEPYLFHLRRS